MSELSTKTEQGVKRSRESWFGKVTQLFNRIKIEDETWEELEELLISADVGVDTTDKLIQKVKQLSEGQIEWKEGMLYPVLHRLEEQGFIDSQWRTVDSGRRRRYYYLKKAGQKALEAEKRQWIVVHSTLMKLWGLNNPGTSKEKLSDQTT